MSKPKYSNLQQEQCLRSSKKSMPNHAKRNLPFYDLCMNTKQDTDIPDNSRGSFYHGDVYITLKDKICQPSNPFRHAAETIKIVRSYFSHYDVNTSKPIIVRYTDVGPDHWRTFASVQLTSILELITLDLDIIIACICAITILLNGWCLLLNLGLQNVLLTRRDMECGHEINMKSLWRMSAVRNNKTEALKPALKESVNAPVQIVKDIFTRLKRTHRNVYAHNAWRGTEITQILDISQIVCHDLHGEQDEKLKDLSKYPELHQVVQRRCRKRQYSFQVL